MNPSLDPLLRDKFDRLKDILSGLGSAVVAFSGGVDSTFLLAVAARVLGERVLAVTALSETFPERELDGARALARQLGVRHYETVSEELDIPQFRHNPPDRCYYCKKELFGRLRSIADEQGFSSLLDGTNLDDLGDHRPGRRAAAEVGVVSPLQSAGLTKEEIRILSRHLGLPTWDKPAFACLSSRFPYGTPITLERVRQVGQAEEHLRAIGFRILRVRYHGDVARLELGPEEMGAATGRLKNEVVGIVKRAGFIYVSIDLEGYRTGSMNEVPVY
jgi:uncharacterized protein